MKLSISADMEGTASVCSWTHVNADYADANRVGAAANAPV